MIMEAMKTQGREANLWGICLHFLFTVTINRHRILNNKTCVTRRHWLKVKLSFFIKLNSVLFAQCIIIFFELIDPTEGLSLTHSCSCSRTTSQRSRITYIEHNFVISHISFIFLHYHSSFHRRQLSLWFVTLFVSRVPNYVLKWV